MKKAICCFLIMLIFVCTLSGCQTAEDENEIVTVYCVQRAEYHKINNGKHTSTTCTYYDNGFLKSRMRNAEVTDSFTYDERGNVLSGPNGRIGNSTYTYDENDNILTETWWVGDSVKRDIHTYGERNQLIKTESLTNGKVVICETFEYDFFGRKISSAYEYTEPRDVPNIYQYWTYDSKGNMLTRKIYYGDVLRTDIVNTYYPSGRLKTSIEKMDGKIESKTFYAYDADGNMTLQAMRSGKSAIPEEPLSDDLSLYLELYRYDKNGNLVRHTSIAEEGEPYTYTYTYDEQGRKLSSTDETTKTEWEYDEHGNLVEYRWYYEGELSFTIQYLYRSFEVPRWAAEIIEKQQAKYLDVPNQWM